jgi:hypothetical protein
MDPDAWPVKSLSLLAGLLLATRLVAAEAVTDMTDAAQRFLAALGDDQRAKARFEWTDDERQNWHFVPQARKGIPLKDLGSAQQHLALGLLSSGLSHRGYLKATTIMSLEQILQDSEGPNRRFPRDPDLYHVSIFGTPDAKGTWGWRFEGHHLSVNFTVVNGKVAAGTPSFLGTNPAEVRTGPRAGLRTLGVEEDLARELVQGLSPAHLKLALLDVKAPDDILTLATRKADIGEAKGVTLGSLPTAQRELAVRLIREFVGRERSELAQADMARIEAAGVKKIRFAWAGGLKRGEKHYFRIHGPTFLLEWDNTQNDGNHVHAVWRDFANDFGLDALAEHLRKSHGK